MNWRSGLELGVRLINWIWAYDLVRDLPAVRARLGERFLHAVYLHCWDNVRRYSRASSANNHLVGEAAGVYVAAAYLSTLPHARTWRHEARDILEREILQQSYPDGCTREQALGYQFFVLQFYLVSGLIGNWIGEPFSDAYWQRLERMVDFLSRLSAGGNALPLFGDNDDGYVLDLGDDARDPGALLCIGALLWQRPDFRHYAARLRESACWLFGPAAPTRFDAIPDDAPKELSSQAFPDSGYYLLQTGRMSPDERLSVLFDCAEHGYGAISAHGHADALSFTLRAFGQDVLVDPGTYDYYTHTDWRRYFRSTPAHNTITIDDTDQSEILGNFMWGARANARCLRWTPRPDGGTVVGEHDGYRRLPDPVTHRRELELAGHAGILTLRDDIVAAAEHRITLHLHFAEHARLVGQSDHHWVFALPDARVVVELDPRLMAQVFCGSTQPMRGWVSRGYHHKAPAPTLVASMVARGPLQLVTRIRVTHTA
jgi:hypothetical protein